jgi:EPS-associated MarR family transcriptional regulator
MNLETRLTLLRALEQNPDLSQRKIAEKLGISLGKTNYCLKALIERGWVKAGNFGKSKNKSRYFYQLTPSGLTEKAKMTQRFLKRKLKEHEQLLKQIEQLRQEVDDPAARRKVIES